MNRLFCSNPSPAFPVQHLIRSNLLLRIFFLTMGVLCSPIIFSQPSGGPYGPVARGYELPAVKGSVVFVAPDGKPEASGNTLQEPTTIEKAFERVKTGDAIVLRGGVYRTGNLVLNQGITIQPYLDEKPVFKGTYVASQWKLLRNGLWVTTWDRFFPSAPQDWWVREYQGKYTPQHRFNNDMVFVNGKFLQSAGWEGDVDENSYFINYETGQVFIGTNPTGKLVEITAFNVGIHRITGECHGKSSDKKGFTLRGITLTQYAYRAIEVEGTEPEGISAEKDHGKEVVGTTIEDCTISYCSRVAAYLRGDHLTIRNCRVAETSTEGIYVIASSDVLLEKNIFTHNNIEGITGYFPAAVKIFNQSYRVTCRDNLVIDLPYSNGIWYDVGNVDGVFVNNWIQDVGLLNRPFTGKQTWPSENGFFFEISKNAVCAGNIFVNCEQGIHILNSSNARIYNNTFVNSTAVIGRNERSALGDHFGWHPATGPDVDKREGHVFVNNLLTGDDNFRRPLLFVWQPGTLCSRLNAPQLKEIHHNEYVFSSLSKGYPVILWSPAPNDSCQVGLETPDSLAKIRPGFAAYCNIFHDEPVFKSPELGNYQMRPQFIGALTAVPLPAEIKVLMGSSAKKTQNYVGAYPPDAIK